MLIDLKIFDTIKIIDRNRQTLIDDNVSPAHALRKITNIEEWNHEKEHLEYDFLKLKAKILQEK